MPSELLFAGIQPKILEPKYSLGAKWPRLLDALDLAPAVEGRRTAVKVHLGGEHGFTTVQPFFVRRLVEKVKAAGAKDVFVTDSAGAVRSAVERGYTAEVLGCPLVPVSGTDDRYVVPRRLDPPFRTLSEVRLAGEIVNAEALVDLSHIKAHGVCGFGGASKNLAMGCVDQQTRTALHALEGGLRWDAAACTHCRACADNCPNRALSFDEQGQFTVFYHNCKFCQHCVLVCPQKAIGMVGGVYRDFQMGMALATSEVLTTFARDSVVYINVLLNITIFCDCWGMSSPSLVPDIGILAGRDLVAIEQASLDLIRSEALIPGALPPDWPLGGQGHLFERVHRKDPYVVLEHLAELGWGGKEYTLREIE